jgi:hypothetical protein
MPPGKKEPLPAYLYHATNASGDTLRPATAAGMEDDDDADESSGWLYASVNMDEVIATAMGSLLQKQFQSKRFTVDGNNVTIEFPRDAPLVTRTMIDKKRIFLFTIGTQREDRWEKVEGSSTLWKTQRTIRNTVNRRHVEFSTWLRKKNVTIIHPRM